MAGCEGKTKWPEGPKCEGSVRSILVATVTVRLMGRSVEAVWLCQAHAAYAEERGLAVVGVDDVA
jgi:hypothetical protein